MNLNLYFIHCVALEFTYMYIVLQIELYWSSHITQYFALEFTYTCITHCVVLKFTYYTLFCIRVHIYMYVYHIVLYKSLHTTQYVVLKFT
jgi:hypothetical protein